MSKQTQRTLVNASEVTIRLMFDHNSIKADSHIACRAHAVPVSCRADKGLECVFSV